MKIGDIVKLIAEPQVDWMFDYLDQTLRILDFPTEKAAACAVDAFIEDDDRFDAEYISKYSNRINHTKDFATMNEEMKAAAEVGRSKATKEAPVPAPAP